MNDKKNNLILNLDIEDKFSNFSNINQLKTAIIEKATSNIIFCSDKEYKSFLQRKSLDKTKSLHPNNTRFSLQQNELSGIIPLDNNYILKFLSLSNKNFNENIEINNINDLSNFLPEEEIYLLKCNIEYLLKLTKLILPSKINNIDKKINNHSLSIENALPIAITWLDMDGNVINANKASNETFGYPSEEMITKSVFDFCIEMKKEEWGDIVRMLKANNYFKAEKILTKKDGNLLHAQSFLVYLKGDNYEHIICFLFDNLLFSSLQNSFNDDLQTLNKNLKDANLFLEDAKLNKERFLSTISHELRTPLNSIIGFNKLLTLEYYGKLNEQQKQYLEYIENSSQELLELVNDIINFTKIQSGEMELQIYYFNISELIQDITYLMNKRFKTKEIIFTCKDNTKNQIVKSDKDKIRRVIFNLLTNSLKFTNEKGLVELSAEIEEETLIITVRDTGIGIPEKDQENIFRMFYKTQQAFDNVIRGTGVGLAISKKLVEMLGGTISLSSKVGEGSKFWFEIPTNIEIK